MEFFKFLKNLIFRGKDDSTGKSPADNSGYARIIKEIMTGELRADQNGTLRLPDRFNGIIEGNNVYTSESAEANRLIIFPVWIGKGYNLRGYLFADRSLSENETFKNYDGETSVSVGRAEVIIEKQINDNWYFVSRSLD